MCQASLRVVISQLQLQLVMPQLLFHSKLGEGHWSNPKPTDKPFKVWLHLHFTFLQMTPSHVEVNRCSGGCFHRQQSCLPTRVKKKKIPVSTKNFIKQREIVYKTSFFNGFRLLILALPYHNTMESYLGIYNIILFE